MLYMCVYAHTFVYTLHLMPLRSIFVQHEKKGRGADTIYSLNKPHLSCDSIYA